MPELNKRETSQNQAKEHEGKNPFEGIDYFQKFDKQVVRAIEVGKPGSDSWLRAEYYPLRGCYRVLFRDKGRLYSWDQNMRTSWESNSVDENQKKFIQRGKGLLEKIGVIPEFPEGYGYPELKSLIEKLEVSSAIDTRKLIPGEYYAVLDPKQVSFFKFSHNIEEILAAEEGVIHSCPKVAEVFGFRYGVKVDREGKWWTTVEIENRSITEIFFNPKTGKRTRNDWGQKIYQLNKEDLEKIILVMPPDYDPLTGTEITREAFSIETALQGLQYTRWGKQEGVGKFSKDPAVNQENYGKALEAIINRFGSEVFARVVEKLFREHLDSLHTNLHFLRPYKPHSDISPLGPLEMRMARQVINETHPLAKDMTRAGNVVNAVSLFRDQDFWDYLTAKRPSLFWRLTDYLLSLPRNLEQQHNTYANAVIDPVGVIKKYFPEAYEIIHGVRNDFDSDVKEPIRITKKKGRS